jgi:hypothetical protein
VFFIPVVALGQLEYFFLSFISCDAVFNSHDSFLANKVSRPEGRGIVKIFAAKIFIHLKKLLVRQVARQQLTLYAGSFLDLRSPESAASLGRHTGQKMPAAGFSVQPFAVLGFAEAFFGPAVTFKFGHNSSLPYIVLNKTPLRQFLRRRCATGVTK